MSTPRPLVAAIGSTQASASATIGLEPSVNIVTTDTAQTITGIKTYQVTDAANNNPTVVAGFQHLTSGTPGAGIATAVTFTTQATGGALTTAGFLSSITNVTTGATTFDIFSTFNGALSTNYGLRLIGGVASIVNGLSITPSATGVAVAVTPYGTDTNTSLKIYPKGTASNVGIWDGSGSNQIFGVTGAGGLTVNTTDGSGTPGAVTINKPSGKAAIASSSASIVITNSLVTSASSVFVQLQTTDATLHSVQTVVPAAGSFTVTCNATATGTPTICFLVIN